MHGSSHISSCGSGLGKLPSLCFEWHRCHLRAVDAVPMLWCRLPPARMRPLADSQGFDGLHQSFHRFRTSTRFNTIWQSCDRHESSSAINCTAKCPSRLLRRRNIDHIVSRAPKMLQHEHRAPAKAASAQRRPTATFAHTHIQLYLVLSFAAVCLTYDSTQVESAAEGGIMPLGAGR